MQKLHENRHMQIVKLKRVADKHPVSTLSPKSGDLLATSWIIHLHTPKLTYLSRPAGRIHVLFF